MTNQLTQEQMFAELQRLREENDKLKGHGIRVSEKGAVSVYGLGRFPITLYKGQWHKLFDKVEAIKQFIVDNNARLAEKPTSKATPEEQVA